MKCNSNSVIFQDFSDLTFPLSRKLTELGRLGEETFLRSTERILARFYGLVFIIEGADWHVLKSEYLPIYFIRVSVKNVKYPFRILVIDNESENHVRVRTIPLSCNFFLFSKYYTTLRNLILECTPALSFRM